MRYYIAYKYSKNENKEKLKEKLEKVSQILNDSGHDTFILGRDVKKWKHIHFGSIKLIPVIYKNMKACDALAAYVDSSKFSKGLLFECVISKLLGKRSVLIEENPHNAKSLHPFFNAIYVVDKVEDFSADLL
jgi:hypothetical protein